MKFPKTFRPEKGLDEKIKYLLDSAGFENSHASPIRVRDLMLNAAKFMSERDKANAVSLDSCKLAEEIVQDMEYYNKYDLEYFARVITEDNSNRHLGEYISALLNKIIQEDEIICLELREPLDYLGYKLERGTLVIKGDAGNALGSSNNGGKIIVDGNARDSVGFQMKKGCIIVNKDVKDYLGLDIYGGEIHVGGDAKRGVGYMTYKPVKLVVHGDVENISNSCKGLVMVYGKIGEIEEGCTAKIYEHGKKVKP